MCFFVCLTDMEFGEQLTAPALHMASSSTSSSSAPPKAASTECGSQEPGAAGGSSLNTCGTLTHNVPACHLKRFGHKVEYSANCFWCVIYLLFIMNKMVQSFQLGWGLSVLAGPSAVTVSTVLNTQAINICKLMHSLPPISDCVPYLRFYTRTTKAKSIWRIFFLKYGNVEWQNNNTNANKSVLRQLVLVPTCLAKFAGNREAVEITNGRHGSAFWTPLDNL